MSEKLMDFDQKILDDLIEFNRKVYPSRKGIKESILYKLSASEHSIPKSHTGYIKIATNKEGRIIGQFQRIPCRYSLNGEKADAFWGMDYIVEEDSRGTAAGVFLAKDALKDPHFGMGLSPISYKIHLLLGEVCIGEYRKYMRFKSLFSLAKFGLAVTTKLPAKIPDIKSNPFPKQIKANKLTTYNRIDDLCNIEWSHEPKKRIEFDRSISFMKWRFGAHPGVFTCYTLVSDQECLAYFVCRYVLWKGTLFLLLVDYRYKEEYLGSLIKATCRLLIKSKALGIITLSSYFEADRELRHRGFWRFGINGKIVTNIKHEFSQEVIEQRRAVMVTFADSDADFFYGNKEWYAYE